MKPKPYLEWTDEGVYPGLPKHFHEIYKELGLYDDDALTRSAKNDVRYLLKKIKQMRRQDKNNEDGRRAALADKDREIMFWRRYAFEQQQLNKMWKFNE